MKQIRLLAGMATILCVASASAFTTLGTKWAVGPNASVDLAGNEGTAGHATWSIMNSGLGMTIDSHGGNTLSFGNLVGGSTTAEETTMITAALNTWGAFGNFTFAAAADGNAAGGANNGAGGHLGDIRLASFNTGFGGSVIAHAWQPGCETSFGAGWNIGGDTHFNANFSFFDAPGAGAGVIDFQTIALHELGHALGLGHSTSSGSVMEAVYAGARRSLTSDDIAGIQFIYGAAVPEHGTFVAVALGLGAFLLRRRR